MNTFTIEKKIKLISCLTLLVAGHCFGQFATNYLTWKVPSEHNAENGLYSVVGTSYTDGGKWATLDINGDGLPDMVLTAEYDASQNQTSVYGKQTTPYWKVYLNTGNGFSTTATTWRVPNEHVAEKGLYALNGASYTLGGFWSTIDINGDGLPDMVLTGEYDSSQNHTWVYNKHTTPYWKVYLNTGSGFSMTPITWRVPSEHNAENGIYSTVGASYTVGGLWNTMDINGDDLPDLVLTGEYDASQNQTWVYNKHTTPNWKVYLNTGNGFSTTATTWRVPSEHSAEKGLYSTVGASYTVGGLWNTMDINGDDLPDMVLTAEYDASQNQTWVYNKHTTPNWKVYLNTGNGFSTTATTWRVPSEHSAEKGLYSTVGVSYTEGGVWSTMDINGDRLPDMVLTGDYDASQNQTWVYSKHTTPYWKVYLNKGNGFSTTPTTWWVPSEHSAEKGLYSTAGASYTVGGFWNTMDINGDGSPDMVLTGEYDASQNKTWVYNKHTTPYWKVYLNTTVTGFEEFETQTRSIHVYPNPSSNIINMDLNALNRPVISVYDNQGRLVYQDQDVSPSTFTLSTEEFVNGIYYVKIKDGNKQMGAKFIKR